MVGLNLFLIVVCFVFNGVATSISFIPRLRSSRRSHVLQARSTLTAQQQNGGSIWGTDSQSTYPYVIAPELAPITINGSNPYISQPNTGRTLNYTLVVAPCNIAPDGVPAANAICFNGSYPGPLIYAIYGDMISVTVINNLPNEGTSVHWHGLLQSYTPWSDGVPGVSQCPIAPGSKQTYLFRATLYGSSWYHTHYSSQYMSGAVGPIMIQGPPSANPGAIDLGPVMATDWYHNNYTSYVENILRPLSAGGPIPPIANSNLIQGKNVYPCSKASGTCNTGSYARFNFTSGATHRLRLMNVGSGAIQKFSIDGHNMTVIANDFMPVQPYNTSMVALGVGQRADVLVQGIGQPGSKYWLRANIVACSLNDGIQTEALAVIYYNGADRNTLPSAPANSGPAANTNPQSCANDLLSTTIPSYQIPVKQPTTTMTLNIQQKSNGTHMLYYFGNQSFRALYTLPDLFNRLLNNTVTLNQPNQNILQMGSNSTVRVVIYNFDDAPHPIHLHGHNFLVLQTGFGQWDGSIVRPSNPQRRDTQVMFPGTSTTPSYIVLQWDQDNPGYWPLHCHFAIHASMGLFAVVEERPSDIMSYNQQGINNYLFNQCNTWNTLTKGTSVLSSDFDSGV